MERNALPQVDDATLMYRNPLGVKGGRNKIILGAAMLLLAVGLVMTGVYYVTNDNVPLGAVLIAVAAVYVALCAMYVYSGIRLVRRPYAVIIDKKNLILREKNDYLHLPLAQMRRLTIDCEGIDAYLNVNPDGVYDVLIKGDVMYYTVDGVQTSLTSRNMRKIAFILNSIALNPDSDVNWGIRFDDLLESPRVASEGVSAELNRELDSSARRVVKDGEQTQGGEAENAADDFEESKTKEPQVQTNVAADTAVPLAEENSPLADEGQAAKNNDDIAAAADNAQVAEKADFVSETSGVKPVSEDAEKGETPEPKQETSDEKEAAASSKETQGAAKTSAAKTGAGTAKTGAAKTGASKTGAAKTSTAAAKSGSAAKKTGAGLPAKKTTTASKTDSASNKTAARAVAKTGAAANKPQASAKTSASKSGSKTGAGTAKTGTAKTGVSKTSTAAAKSGSAAKKTGADATDKKTSKAVADKTAAASINASDGDGDKTQGE